MCGRFTLDAPDDEVAEFFGVATPHLAPRYNVAPAQLVAVVGLKPDGKTRGLALLKWGFVPSWSNDPNPKVKPINARAETLLHKPTFRESFLHKRCLIPATGFYEWRKADRQPFYIRLKGGGLFAFAGLWDAWHGDGKPLLSCCIITTAANDLVRPLHDRMPAMLTAGQFNAWLDPATPPDALSALLVPFPSDALEMIPVSRLVNSPKNEGPQLLTPAA